MKLIFKKISNIIFKIFVKLDMIQINDKKSYLKNKLIVKEDLINHDFKLDFFEECSDKKKGKLFLKQIKKKILIP